MNDLQSSVAQAIYEAWNPSGVPWESPIVQGNAFREGKAMAQAAAALRVITGRQEMQAMNDIEKIIVVSPDSEAKDIELAPMNGGGLSLSQRDCTITADGNVIGNLISALHRITGMNPITYERMLDCYGEYDGDPRVGGPDDFEAFTDAVAGLLEQLHVEAVKPWVR